MKPGDAVATVEIRGKPWKVTYIAGRCDKGERLIELAEGQSREDLINTVVHEVCHAVAWKMPEKTVDTIATAVGTILNKLL